MAASRDSADWSHGLLGHYSPKYDGVSIDFLLNLNDPNLALMTVSHEMTHVVLSRTTEMGLTTKDLLNNIDDLDHFDEDEKKDVIKLLLDSQRQVQESFATFMSICTLGKKIDKSTARRYAANELNESYKVWYEKLSFAFDWPLARRERLQGYISVLCLQTNIRRDAPKLNLYGSLRALQKYFEEPDNNPEQRMNALCELLRYKRHLINKPLETICAEAGIKFFPPPSPEEVAEHVNYIRELQGNDRRIDASEVGSAPEGIQALANVHDELHITNINPELDHAGAPIVDPADISFEASHAATAMVIKAAAHLYSEVIEEQYGYQPDTLFLFKYKDGVQYMATSSFDMAAKLTKNELESATLLTVAGMYDPFTKKSVIPDMRPPDVVWYGQPKYLRDLITQNLQKTQNAECLIVRFGESHPFHTLIMRINGEDTLHITTGLGLLSLSLILEQLGDKTVSIEMKDLAGSRQHINYALASVLNLSWDVDWYGTFQPEKP